MSCTLRDDILRGSATAVSTMFHFWDCSGADVPHFGQMSVTFRFLCVVILNSGGFLRTMVNCSSDLCRVNPDS